MKRAQQGSLQTRPAACLAALDSAGDQGSLEDRLKIYRYCPWMRKDENLSLLTSLCNYHRLLCQVQLLEEGFHQHSNT